MSLTEIKALIADKNLTPQLLENSMMKTITWNDQWIAYDDEDTIAMKMKYANSHCFGGTMAWSVDLDSGVGQSSSPPVSTDNTCGPQNGEVCPAGQCCSGSGVSWLHQYRDGPLLIFNLQYCGNGEPYCGAGCYSGNCVTGSVSQTFAPTVGQTTLSNLH